MAAMRHSVGASSCKEVGMQQESVAFARKGRAPQREGLTGSSLRWGSRWAALPQELLEECSFLKRKLTFIFSIHTAWCGLTGLVMKTTQVRTLMTVFKLGNCYRNVPLFLFQKAANWFYNS